MGPGSTLPPGDAALVKLSPTVRNEWFPERVIPVAFPLAMLIIKLTVRPAGDPGDTLKMLGFDLAFIGINFDIWAIQTLLGGRLVTFGGLVELPEAEPDRKAAQRCEGFRLVTVIVVQVLAMAYLIRAEPLSPSFLTKALGLFAGLVLPLCVLFPIAVPRRTFYEAS